LEKSHKLQVKRQSTQQEEENIIFEGEAVFQDMELDITIDDIDFPDDE
jgi:hypothetical protein